MKEEYKLDLYAIYINHGLRPEEIPDEIKFCKKLCGNLNIPFITKTIDVISYAKELGLNKQEAARELRYKALEEVAIEKGEGALAALDMKKRLLEIQS